ncbi:NAD-dependent epimerase/dehydratase family protein [Salinibacter altiplanensis]|uniref:NAD-dependent epimerase/dehydratase family protein n=1 Tax=Salinibacter altiplanensis TaxID=1803181 RepID=UPI000C9EFBD6|nr:NAD-dependent epimerase/dehydratase family protein [Salinibacter altiplanensis]
MRILVTGANGQIGSELVEVLRERHGTGQVVGLDLNPPPMATDQPSRAPSSNAPFEVADVRNREALADVLDRHEVGSIYHLASLLSATGEQHPDRAWDVNMSGLKTILDLARSRPVEKVFWPSSIAVFGPTTPREDTPQNTVLDPTTMYGVTKRSGELLCRYYHRRYDLDVRSLRYPGLLSYKTAPGGGTTDYAIDMLTQAAAGRDYTCFLKPDTRLPMMYMPDAIQGTLALMDADADALSVRDSYNTGGLSFSPEELAATIQARVPSFSCSYAPDERQHIAENWPSSVNDDAARTDWGWAPEYDLEATTADMLDHLREGAPEHGDIAEGEHKSATA